MATAARKSKPVSLQADFVRITLFVAGLFYTLVGLAMVFAPLWFYENAGTFPPFNRHYAGDLGLFNLPLGVLLIWAAQRPAAHRSLFLLVLLINWLHAINHLYDDFVTGAGLIGPLWSSVPLLIFAAVFTLAYWTNARISSAAR
ncbi:MAG: hypothetical protein K8L99_33180 [Anaerolineae bacterium]|nr:hypothetical protein [Anaerolineae bacterium]